jgi:hypothetical protein
MSLQVINGVLPLVFFGYQWVIDSVNLFPFNDVERKDKKTRKIEILMNYPPLFAISLCFFIHTFVSMAIGTALTLIIFVMHLSAWWIPYLFGSSSRMKHEYDRLFGRTYRFLPPIKDHIVPDAEHCGVGLFLITLTVFQILDLFK